MGWERLIDVPLSLNEPTLVPLPGGGEVFASLGPADFPTHALVTCRDVDGGKRLIIKFFYFQGHEEPTATLEHEGASVTFGKKSRRLFILSVPAPAGLTEKARFTFDVVTAAKRQERTGPLSTREVAHYQAMAGALLPFVAASAFVPNVGT